MEKIDLIFTRTLVFVLLSILSFSNLVADQVAHYSFENSVDDNLNNYNGTINGNVEYVTSPIDGQALRFNNGTPGYVDLGFVSELADAPQYTISTWVNVTHWSQWQKILCTFGDNGPYSFGLYLDTPGVIVSRLGNAASDSTQAHRTNIASSSLPVGEWALLTTTFDGSLATDEEKLKLYINGEQVIDATYANGPFATTSFPNIEQAPLTIRNDNASCGFELDELTLWDTAISAEEIATEFTENNPYQNRLLNLSFAENSMPEGWTADGSHWEVSSSGSYPFFNMPEAPYLRYYSGSYGDNPTTPAYFTSPVIDASQYSQAQLNFDYIKSNAASLTVQISVDGGTNWENVYTNSGSIFYITEISVDLSESQISDNFQLRFKVTGNFFYNDYVAIDNIILEGIETGILDGTVTLNGGSDSVESVTVAAGGFTTNPDANGYYSFTLIPGNYTVTTDLYGYTTGSSDIIVEADVTTTQDFSLDFQAGTLNGTIALNGGNGNVEYAQIYVDGTNNYPDAAGNYSITLNPGDYEVVYAVSAYQTTTASVTIEAGSVFTQDVMFEPSVGPFAVYNFENNVEDEQGNYNGQILIGTTGNEGTVDYVTSHDGSMAASMNGDVTKRHVDFGYMPELNKATEYTISCWMNFSAWAKWKKILTRQDKLTGLLTSGNSTPGHVDGPPQILSAVKYGGGDLGYQALTDLENGIALNEWMMVTTVFDGSETDSLRMKLYVNGVQIPSTTGDFILPEVSFDNAGNPTLLRHNANNQVGLDFSIDDIYLYNYAIDASEVASLYGIQETGILAGVVTLNGEGNVEDVLISVGNDITINPDSLGNYTLELDTGAYNVTTSLDGFITSTENVAISANETTTLDITLEEVITIGTLSGNIALNQGDGNVEDVLISIGEITTNPDSLGYYSIELEQGTYSVNASLIGYDLFVAEDVVIIPEETTILDITLEEEILFGTVSGHVSLDGEGDVEMVYININGESTSPDADGNYSLTVQTGTHILTASLSGFYTVSITDVVIENDENTAVDITLTPNDTVGLVSYYTFENSVNDLMGNNNGEIVGTVNYLEGPMGTHIDLGVETGMVDLGFVDELADAPQYTMSCWIKINTWQWWQKILVTYEDNGPYSFGFYTAGPGRIMSRVGNADSAEPHRSNVIGDDFPVGEWAMLTTTFDGSQPTDEEKLKLYFNGELVVGVEHQNGPYAGTSFPNEEQAHLTIRNDQNGVRFEMDNLRIYDNTLTAEEISALYVEDQGWTEINGNVTLDHSELGNIADIRITAGSDTTYCDENGDYSLMLMPNDYNLKARLAGYFPQTQSITVVDGINETYNFNLIKKNVLETNIYVVGADVSMDDVTIEIDFNGTITPDEFGHNEFILTEGDHYLEMTAPGFDPIQEMVTTDATSTLTKYYTFTSDDFNNDVAEYSWEGNSIDNLGNYPGINSGNVDYVDGGISGQAVRFTPGNSDTKVDLGFMEPINYVQNVSMATWMKMEDFATWNRILGKTSQVGFSTGSNAGELFVMFRDWGNNSWGSVTGLDLMDNWVHIAFTYDGTQDTNQDKLKLFINGEYVAFENWGADIPDHSISQLKSSIAGSSNLGCLLDESKMWSRTLTAEEITEMYNNEQPTPATISGTISCDYIEDLSSAIIIIGDEESEVNADGTYTAENLNPGIYDVEVYLSGWSSEAQEITIINGVDVTNVDFTLTEDAYFDIDFNPFLTSFGWTTEGNLSSQWVISQTNNAGGEVPEMFFGSTTPNDGYQDGEARLNSPVIDVSDRTNLSLSFRASTYSYYDAGVTFYAQVKFDGGEWETVWSATNDNAGQLYTIDFEDTDAQTMQLSFAHIGNLGMIDQFMIDDILLTADPNGTLEGNVTLAGTGNIENLVLNCGELTINPDAEGNYSLKLVPGIYEISASMAGYQTAVYSDLEVVKYQTTVQNIDMAISDEAVISGTITLEYGSGDVEEAIVTVGDESVNPISSGYYEIAVEEGIYTMSVSLDGYTAETVSDINTVSGEITTVDVTLELSDIPAPGSLIAEVSDGQDVELNWTSSFSLPSVDFEDGELPEGWEIITTCTVNNPDTGEPGTWHISDYANTSYQPYGTYSARIMYAGMENPVRIQDEWLITKEFYCAENSTLEFNQWVFEGIGVFLEDHYAVKVSIDGGESWDVLWDPIDEAGYLLHTFDETYSMDLSAYSGESIKIAWHALGTPGGLLQGALNHPWGIDNIRVMTNDGRNLLAPENQIARQTTNNNVRRNARKLQPGDNFSQLEYAGLTMSSSSNNRVSEGYNVYFDTELIAELDNETFNYQIEDLLPGTHEFYVTSRFTHGESEPSEIVSLEITVESPEYAMVNESNFEWQACGDSDFLRYEIFVDDMTTVYGTTTETSFDLSAIDENTHIAGVRYVLSLQETEVLSDIFEMEFTNGSSIEAGMFAYYPLNGNADNAISDNYNGTVVGTVNYSDSEIDGESLQISEGTNYINLGVIEELNGTTEFTMSAWINVSPWSAGKQILGRSGEDLGFKTLNPAGTILCRVASPTSNGYCKAPTTAEDSWSQITMVYDGNEETNWDKVKFYMNGERQFFVNQDHDFASVTQDLNEPFIIGSEAGGINISYDEIRIWDRIVSPLEINSLYEQVAPQLPVFSGTVNLNGGNGDVEDCEIRIDGVNHAVEADGTFSFEIYPGIYTAELHMPYYEYQDYELMINYGQDVSDVNFELNFIDENVPANLTSEIVSTNDVVLSWSAITSNIDEDFESGELTEEWEIIATCPGSTPENPLNWAVSSLGNQTDGIVPFGNYHALLLGSGVGHEQQDEWLITPQFLCTENTALEYESCVLLGLSYWGTDVYPEWFTVKVTDNNGLTWNQIWSNRQEEGGYHNYAAGNFNLDLSQYAGSNIKVAFHARSNPYNGLFNPWALDNININSNDEPVLFSRSNQISRNGISSQATSSREILGYNIYRNNVLIETVGSDVLTYTDISLAEGEYTYEITSVIEEGESNPSNSTEVSINLNSPTGLSYEFGDDYNTFTLNWNSPARRLLLNKADGLERTFVGYQIFENEVLLAETDDVNNYELSEVENGLYSYKVRAMFGEELVSEFSNTVELWISNDAPVNFAGILEDETTVTLSWENPNSENVNITGYNLYRNDEIIQTLDSETDSFTDENLENEIYTYYLTALYYGTFESLSSDVYEIDLTGNDDETIPAVTELTGNYPNPFNPTTTIKFGLSQDSEVSLQIFNVKGQLVKTVIDSHMDAGYHSIKWEGLDNNNKPTTSGFYFYRLKADSYVSVRKMIQIK